MARRFLRQIQFNADARCSCTLLKQIIPIYKVNSQLRGISVYPRNQPITHAPRIFSIARQFFLESLVFQYGSDHRYDQRHSRWNKCPNRAEGKNNTQQWQNTSGITRVPNNLVRATVTHHMPSIHLNAHHAEEKAVFCQCPRSESIPERDQDEANDDEQ